MLSSTAASGSATRWEPASWLAFPSGLVSGDSWLVELADRLILLRADEGALAPPALMSTLSCSTPTSKVSASSCSAALLVPFAPASLSTSSMRKWRRDADKSALRSFSFSSSALLFALPSPTSPPMPICRLRRSAARRFRVGVVGADTVCMTVPTAAAVTVVSVPDPSAVTPDTITESHEVADTSFLLFDRICITSSTRASLFPPLVAFFWLALARSSAVEAGSSHGCLRRSLARGR
mmetsp:Transcript_15513/g.33454  ORF Transcript_15513/g.33454 Transcript_15513/m.33454 type:complete len:237 (+) Transcript_15513:2545-3255(+)